MVNVMFAGPSGIGKTTTAKWLIDAQVVNGVFISGSVSDLIPKTKELSHKDMLDRDSKTLQMEDYQVVNLRNKAYKSSIEQGTDFVTDRSYLDSAAYFTYKQAKTIPQCELEHFLELNKMLLCQQCTHLVVFDFTPKMIKEWVMEDNDKRILNKYFQFEISVLMKSLLKVWGCNLVHQDTLKKNWLVSNIIKDGYDIGKIKSIYGDVQVICIQEANLDIRKRIITQFINGKI